MNLKQRFEERYSETLKEFLQLYNLYKEFTDEAIKYYEISNGDNRRRSYLNSVIVYRDILEFNNCFVFKYSDKGDSYWREWWVKYNQFIQIKNEMKKL